MGSGASAISIHVDGEQSIVAGKQITGTVMFNNTSGKSHKFQRIYAEFIGEVIYSIKHYSKGEDYYNTHHKPFFKQLINLEKKPEGFILGSGYYSWPMCFSLPTFLPPSLNQLSSHGPYLRYKICAVFERQRLETFRMDIYRDFRIVVIAAPSSNSQPAYLPIVAVDRNRSDVTVRATLTDRRSSFAPGDSFLLNLELENPNHNTINGLSIYLVQHRSVGIGEHCKQNITHVDLSHLRGFSGKNYRETLQLTIPNDNRIIPSFYNMPPECSRQPIAVKYMLKIKVKTYGFFNDLVLALPIGVHSIEMHMPSSHEEEEPPPSYDVAIATH